MMKFSYLGIILTAGAFILPGGESFNVTDEYIEDAGNFTRIETTPYVAAIFAKDEIFGSLVLCMATILSESWLLTHAVCWPEDSSKSNLIMTGTSFVYMEKEEHEIDYGLRYQIGRQKSDFDIALIKTKKPIKFSDKQKPISIGKSEDILKVGDIFGATSFPINLFGSAEFLRSANLSVIDLENCEPFHEEGLLHWNQTFCASFLHECDGDEPHCNFRTGTVAIVNDRVVGITLDLGISIIRHATFLFIDPFRDWILEHITSDIKSN